jgi:uncharacterized SAM-binding protein YcdF (DUF218 family)
MNMWPSVIEALIVPPGLIVILLLLTFVVYLRSQWLGSALLVISTTVLVVASLPGTGHMLLAGLERYAKPLDLVPMAEHGPQAGLFIAKDSIKDPPQAIVVLGSIRYSDAPEYDGKDTASALGLERLRYAAYLQRKTGLPILVSGGSPYGEQTAQADFMKSILTDEFKANVKWVERSSRNTLENARFSQALLAEAKIHTVYLVTHAWHMRRALRAFEIAGIHAVPAPTGFDTVTRRDREGLAYLPSARGMYLTSIALREQLGILWYETKDSSGAADEKKLPATTK